MQEPSLARLLFIYVWPTALFENVMVGTREERYAKYARNRQRRAHLAHYGKLWSLFSLLLLGAGLLLAEGANQGSSLVAATVALTGFTCSIAVVVVVAVAYVWLGRMPG